MIGNESFLEEGSFFFFFFFFFYTVHCHSKLFFFFSPISRHSPILGVKVEMHKGQDIYFDCLYFFRKKFQVQFYRKYLRSEVHTLF